MMDYYNLFVELCLQQCTKDDYSDRKKVREHNAALRKLEYLQQEIKKSESDEILLRLLSHEDDRVKLNAASLCLNMNALADKTTIVLNMLYEQSSDSTICFAAKMLLNQQQKQKKAGE